MTKTNDMGDDFRKELQKLPRGARTARELQSSTKTRLGPQRGSLVPCERSNGLHGHHPSDESCPDCLDDAYAAQDTMVDYTPENGWQWDDADHLFP